MYWGIPLCFFVFYNAASVEQDGGDSKKKKEERQRICNILVRLAVDVLLHERVLRCTEAEI